MVQVGQLLRDVIRAGSRQRERGGDGKPATVGGDLIAQSVSKGVREYSSERRTFSPPWPTTVTF